MSWWLNSASVYSMFVKPVDCVSDHIAKTPSFKTTPNTTWFTLQATPSHLVKHMHISTHFCCSVTINIFSHNFQHLYGSFLCLHALTKTFNINYNTSACVFTYHQPFEIDGGGGVRGLISPLNRLHEGGGSAWLTRHCVSAATS